MSFSLKKVKPQELMLNLAFVLILLRPPFEFFFPGMSFYIAIIMFGLVVFFSNPRLISIKWFPYLGIFLFLSLLALTLRLSNADNQLPQRPLFVNFLTVFIAIYLASFLDDKNSRKLLFHSIFLAALIEVCIVLLQFSYISNGFGIRPRFEGAEYTGFITGSYGNANNVSVFLLLSFLLLVEKNYFRLGFIEIIFSGLIAAAIFITISRTALVIFLIFFSVNFLRRNFREETSLVNLGTIAILVLYFFHYLSSVAVDNVIIDRSLDRFESLFISGDGDSSVFRFTSFVRLIENIFNLGLGSMADLNYSEYFQQSDDPLMVLNPHSFIVELSFLFGYPGLICGFLFFIYIFNDFLLINKSLFYVFLCFISVVFLTFVPSSVLTTPVLLIYFILFAKFRKLE